MSGQWQALVRRLDRREPATALAMFRIAVGAVVLYALISMVVADLVGVIWVDLEYGGLQPTDPVPGWLGWFVPSRTPTAMWSLVALAAVGATSLVVGWRARLSAFVTLAAYYGLTTAKHNFAGGYDTLITNALWLLVLADSGATLSVACRRETGAWVSTRLVPAWPRYLAIFQLVITYTTTGLSKLSVSWMPRGDYAALHWVFQDPTWRRFDLDWMIHLFPLTQVATAVTWWWEVGFGLILVVYYLRDTAERGGRLRRVANRFDLRIPFVAIGVGVHVGIMVLLNVGPFSPITLAYYLCLLSPADLSRLRCTSRGSATGASTGCPWRAPSLAVPVTSSSLSLGERRAPCQRDEA